MPKPRVTILCCTYNGEAYLQPQLDSFARQTFKNWHLVVSDDGSTDNTLAIVQNFALQHPGRVTIRHHAPRTGFAQHFLQLAQQMEDDREYFAFSDQDDIWYDDHLMRAVALLSEHPEPSLYGARTDYIDEQGQPVGQSRHFTRPPSFANALVQCIAGGNSMVFNRAAHALIKGIALPATLVSHDWFLYQLITGVGGTALYDSVPALAYRQHCRNLAGGNRGLKASLHRIRRLWHGDFKEWNDKNIQALLALSALLTPSNAHRLQQFHQARHLPGLRRLLKFHTLGLYRQTWEGNWGLWIAVLCGKV